MVTTVFVISLISPCSAYYLKGFSAYDQSAAVWKGRWVNLRR